MTTSQFSPSKTNFRERYQVKNHVDVLIFGKLAQALGLNALELPLSKSTSAADIRACVLTNYCADFSAQASIDPSSVKLMVNRQMVDGDSIVTMGDEVALFLEFPG